MIHRPNSLYAILFAYLSSAQACAVDTQNLLSKNIELVSIDERKIECVVRIVFSFVLRIQRSTFFVHAYRIARAAAGTNTMENILICRIGYYSTFALRPWRTAVGQ